MPSSLLRLLLAPRETLLVLEYISANPTANVAQGERALSMSNSTWYICLRRLEDLSLITPERFPGGKKVRRYHVTPRGSEALEMLGRLEHLIAASPAALQLELKERPPPSRSARAGEVLCLLIEACHRSSDMAGLKPLAALAARFQRPGEAHLARAIPLLVRGRAQEAHEQTAPALELLRAEKETRSYRRTLYLHAAVLEMLGRDKEAFKVNLELRRSAREAKDPALEAGAYLSMGILKGRMGQSTDSAKYLTKGVEVARKAGLKEDEAKLLVNLAFTQFFFDLDAAIATNDECIQAARVSGSRMTYGLAHLNRALYMAAKGMRDDARAALKVAAYEFELAGEERGPEARRDFVRVIRRTLRQPHGRSLPDLRGQVLRSMRILPSQPPGERPGSRSGRSRSG